MSRRRFARPASSRTNHARLQRAVCESLEDRQLLTVLHEGDQFTFRAPNLNLDTIYVSGNPGSTTLEILGARLNDETGELTIDNIQGDLNGGPIGGTVGGIATGPGTQPGIQPIQANLPPPPTGTSPTYATRPPYFYDTVYAVYVAKSDSSSSISFVEHDRNTGAPLDFTNSIGDLRITTRGLVAAPANTGTMLMGARTQVLVTSTNNPGVLPPVQPPLDLPLVGGLDAGPGVFQLIPAGGPITPGVTVVAGNDFGNFLFGGTVLGTANFGGSVNTLYAGWMLFGSRWNGGQAVTIAGNAQAVISKGSIATDDATLEGGPLLYSGFDLHVGGRLGEVRVTGDFMGSVAVAASATVPGAANSTSGPYMETEFRGNDTPPSDDLPNFVLGDDPVSFNDTFNTPELIPITPAGTLAVDGSLNVGPTVHDFVDYYGASLMAGQTITVQLQSIPQLPEEPLDVGIFDPDGRLVATDYNAVDMTFTQQQMFQYTADKPGLYRFAVGEQGNGLFAANGGAVQISGQFPYLLTVTGLSNIAFNGVLADGIVRELGSPSGVGFSLANGDLGAVMAISGVLESEDADTFVVSNGSLLAAQGTSLDNNAVNNRGIVAAVPKGSIGLLSATAGTLTFATDPLVPLGGNIDVISATSSALVTIVADGSLGVLRAGDMATGQPSLIHLNQLNNPNAPATLDLIDVTGDLGTLNAGGPAIITGPGGNVRYIHVGGATFRDAFFGGGAPDQTLFQPGESVQIVDDSGSVVNIIPNQSVTNPQTGVVTTPAGQLTVLTYGIEGSGGSAIVDVKSTGTVTITGSGNSPGQTAEIGSIEAQGVGTPVIPGPATTVPGTGGGNGNTGPNGGNGTGTGSGGTQSIGGQGVPINVNFPLPGTPGGAPIKTNTVAGATNQQVALPPPPVLATGGQPLDVIFNGNAKVDVYSVNGGNFTSIQNQTPGGELVNVTATSIGNLSSAGTIGLTHGALGEDVNGETIFSNTYPFNQQHYGLNVATGIVSINAPRFGNITTGTDGIGAVTGFNAAPVVSGAAINNATLTGMSWAGSGDLGRSGLYAANTIGTVNASNDIRGNIVSNVGILNVNVANGGSLNNAVIMHSDDFAAARAIAGGTTLTNPQSPITAPIHDIGSIRVTGSGGIIGTRFLGEHLGTISSAGFGIFDSRVNETGPGTLDNYIASGYGIRFGFIQGGANVGNITALGDGHNIPVNAYSANVRQSEQGGTFDPNTGLIFSPLNDIDVTLGVTAAQPQSQNVTDAGAIEDFVILGSRNVNLISAYTIRSRPLVIDGITFGFESEFNVANQIGTLQTTGGINGLLLTTGRINKFVTNGDTAGFNGTFAGQINNLVFNSNLDADSVITAIGPNGHINNLTVKGNLAGTVTARTFINNINVYGSITGTITAARIGTVHVRGGLANGGLAVNGPINQLIFDGNAGNSGDTITLNGNSKLVKVGGNLAANLMVSGNLTTLSIAGSILSGSNSTVTGVINLLQIGADLQAGASLTAKLIKRQSIKGTLSGNIITTG